MNIDDFAAGGAEAVVLVVLLLGGLLIVAYAVRTGVPPMPTAAGTRAAMLRLLPDRIEGTVYDLGSGWGGLAFALARRYPDNPVVGLELSPLPWLFSRVMLAIRRLPNLQFRRADMLDVALTDAGAATCYLIPTAMQRLAPKLAAELRPGVSVVSYSFAIDSWIPDAAELTADAGPLPVYRYVIGPRPLTPSHGTSSPAGTAQSPETPR